MIVLTPFRRPRRAARRIVGPVFLWLANWWDGVDLWLNQLPFPFQFAIVIAVLAPVCLGAAWVIDRSVDLVSAWLGRMRGVVPSADRPAPEPEPDPEPVDAPVGGRAPDAAGS